MLAAERGKIFSDFYSEISIFSWLSSGISNFPDFSQSKKKKFPNLSMFPVEYTPWKIRLSTEGKVKNYLGQLFKFKIIESNLRPPMVN